MWGKPQAGWSPCGVSPFPGCLHRPFALEARWSLCLKRISSPQATHFYSHLTPLISLGIYVYLFISIPTCSLWTQCTRLLLEKKELTWSVLMDLFERSSLFYQHTLLIIQNNAWLSLLKRICAQHVSLSQKIKVNIVFFFCYMILSLFWRHFLTEQMEYQTNSIIRAFISSTCFGKTYHTAISSPA